MRDNVRAFSLLACAIAATLVLGGCRGEAERPKTPEQLARETLGVKEGSKERTTETQRDVIVQQTTKVIDRQTGEVLKTQQADTPVRITEEKTVERDVDVNRGETQKVVK